MKGQTGGARLFGLYISFNFYTVGASPHIRRPPPVTHQTAGGAR